MNHLLRKASISSTRSSLIRVLALATARSGLLYATGNSETSILPSLPWQVSQHLVPCPSCLSVQNDNFGNFSRTCSSPSENIKEAFGRVGDHPKPCCGCFGRDSIANAASRVGPAVVNLSIERGFYGIITARSICSGTIIDADGTILTCAHVAHVVVDYRVTRFLSKGRKVDVTLQDGRTFEGTVVNDDLHSDIAVVKINSKTPLPTAKIGASSKLRPGDWVLALGCSRSLQNTLRAGIVSCVDHKSTCLGLRGMQEEYLQTDCAINTGNYGGPLVNIDGEIVGVNIMKVHDADGLGSAVPIDSVCKITEHFKKNGRVVCPWLGLKMFDLNEIIIPHLKEIDAMFPNVDRGVLVLVVTLGSPADHAGFHPGDVVIEFDGKPVESIEEIIELMADRIGMPMKVVVKRSNDTTRTLTVIPKDANSDM